MSFPLKLGEVLALADSLYLVSLISLFFMVWSLFDDEEHIIINKSKKNLIKKKVKILHK